MGDKSPPNSPAFTAYMVVALLCGGSSVLIALVALNTFNQVSSEALWAMAAMVGAPSLMGIGISYFICKSSTVVSPRGFD